MAEKEEFSSLPYSPTWVVAGVCFLIVLISLLAERGLHHLGKVLKHRKQDALFEALQKLKEELMLLGFISLLLTVFQGLVSKICVPRDTVSSMLPCKMNNEEKSHEDYFHLPINNRRRLFSEESGSELCLKEGKVPLLSLEALHQLHIFIFVLAVVHVIFCVVTMLLGGARIRQWKRWEEGISKGQGRRAEDVHHRRVFVQEHARGYWRKAAVVSWTMSFFKQFYNSITKTDYIVLRQGFIQTHCPGYQDFDFHKYMMRTLEVDFKKVVGISWYLWLFVVLFLLLNVKGWHTYFWLSFLPVVLLLLVGAKLEHVIMRLAQDVETKAQGESTEVTPSGESTRVKLSDEHFWFNRPGIVLHLIHFILFQNAFEIAFFFWILSTYGYHSCIMERTGYIVPRLIMGVMVQVLCSYITLPLYALVTQMGSKFKEGMFNKLVHSSLQGWLGRRGEASKKGPSDEQVDKMVKETYQSIQIGEKEPMGIEENTRSITELSMSGENL